MENDEEFLQAFRTGTLPFEQWTHAAHIRMAHLVCKSSKDFDEALSRVRQGIQHFNGLHASKLKVGFHETMTHLWTVLVWNATKQNSNNAADAATFAEHNSFLLNSSLWKDYYSPALMFSPEAKQRYAAPDLKPISVEQ